MGIQSTPLSNSDLIKALQDAASSYGSTVDKSISSSDRISKSLEDTSKLFASKSTGKIWGEGIAEVLNVAIKRAFTEVDGAVRRVTSDYLKNYSEITSKMQWTSQEYQKYYNDMSRTLQESHRNLAFSITDITAALNSNLGIGLRGEIAQQKSLEDAITKKLVPSINTQTRGYRELYKSYQDSFAQNLTAIAKYSEAVLQGAEAFESGTVNTTLEQLYSYIRFSAGEDSEKANRMVTTITEVLSALETSGVDPQGMINSLYDVSSNVIGSSPANMYRLGVSNAAELSNILASPEGASILLRNYAGFTAGLGSSGYGGAIIAKGMGGTAEDAYASAVVKKVLTNSQLLSGFNSKEEYSKIVGRLDDFTDETTKVRNSLDNYFTGVSTQIGQLPLGLTALQDIESMVGALVTMVGTLVLKSTFGGEGGNFSNWIKGLYNKGGGGGFSNWIKGLFNKGGVGGADAAASSVSVDSTALTLPEVGSTATTLPEAGAAALPETTAASGGAAGGITGSALASGAGVGIGVAEVAIGAANWKRAVDEGETEEAWGYGAGTVAGGVGAAGVGAGLLGASAAIPVVGWIALAAGAVALVGTGLYEAYKNVDHVGESIDSLADEIAGPIKEKALASADQLIGVLSIEDDNAKAAALISAGYDEQAVKLAKANGALDEFAQSLIDYNFKLAGGGIDAAMEVMKGEAKDSLSNWFDENYDPRKIANQLAFEGKDGRDSEHVKNTEEIVNRLESFSNIIKDENQRQEFLIRLREDAESGGALDRGEIVNLLSQKKEGVFGRGSIDYTLVGSYLRGLKVVDNNFLEGYNTALEPYVKLNKYAGVIAVVANELSAMEGLPENDPNYIQHKSNAIEALKPYKKEEKPYIEQQVEKALAHIGASDSLVGNISWNRAGLFSVPRDGYLSVLHSDEMVLSRTEAGYLRALTNSTDYRGISKSLGEMVASKVSASNASVTNSSMLGTISEQIEVVTSILSAILDKVEDIQNGSPSSTVRRGTSFLGGI